MEEFESERLGLELAFTVMVQVLSDTRFLDLRRSNNLIELTVHPRDK